MVTMPSRDRNAKPGSERIKEFKVVRRLGKGAFGTVYQVVRKSDGNTYALKKVNISAMSTREIEDALNEIRFLASVHHPNIVGFLEAFLNEVRVWWRIGECSAWCVCSHLHAMWHTAKHGAVHRYGVCGWRRLERQGREGSKIEALLG